MFHERLYGPVAHGPGLGGSGLLIAGLIHLLFWALVIFLIISLLRRGHFHHWHADHLGHQDPLDLAKTRYAKGEITKTELDEIKKTLKD